MSSSIQRKIDSDNNPIDIFTCSLDTFSSGLNSSSGNYVIGKGSDLNTPYLTIDGNNGDVIIGKNLIVNGTTTVANNTELNLETTNLSIGLKDNKIIKSMKQVTNVNYSNYQSYANIIIEPEFLFATGSNIKLNGITNTLNNNYNIVYPQTRYTNIYSGINIIPYTNGNNFGFTDNKNPFFNTIADLNSNTASFYFSSTFQPSYVATVPEGGISGSNITVNTTNGWAQSGTLFACPSVNCDTVSSEIIINTGSGNYNTINQFNVSSSSTLVIGNYIAGEYSTTATSTPKNKFLLGRITAITTNGDNKQITLDRHISQTLFQGSKIYLLTSLGYSSKTSTQFIISSGTIPSNTSQLFSSSTFIGKSELFYFSGSTPTLNSITTYYTLSISTVSGDSNKTYSPIFDCNPPDIKLVGNEFFTLQFDSTLNTPVSFTYNSSSTVGQIQANTVTDGLFSLDFNFTGADNKDSSKSISVGSDASSTNKDSIYFTKTVLNSPETYFKLDYGNNAFDFKNGVNLQNNLANTFLINTNNGSTQITSNATSTSSTTGALKVSGGVGIVGNTNIGGGLGVVGSSTLSSVSVTGNATVGGTFGVSGNTTLNAVNITNATESSSTSIGAVTVTGGMGIGKNVNIGGGLGVVGSSTLSSVGVTNNATIGGTFGVSGNTTLNAVNITNATDSSTTSNGAITITGGMGIGKNVNIGGGLGVVGSSTLSSVGVTNNANIGGTLGVTGNTTLNTVNITNATDSSNASSGAVTVTGGMGISKSVNIGGALGVNGTANMSGTLTVIGQSTLANVGITGALGVTGNTNMDGTLTVIGKSTLGNVGITGTLGITGNTNMDGTLTVIGKSTLGNVGITGALGVTGNTNMDGTLTVIGQSTLGNVGITGALGVTGNTNMSGTLTVIGKSTLGSVGITGALGVTGNTNMDGTLTVIGQSTLGNVGITGALGVTGQSTLGSVRITDTTNSTSSTTGALKIDGGLGVVGNSYFGSSLNVLGNFTSTSTTTSSDARLKMNIKPIDDALNKVLSLNGVTYKWIDQNKYNDRDQIGLIAQDVEKIIPELVLTDDQGMKSVNYSQMVSILIEAIKEQNKMIIELTKKKNKTKRNNDL